MSGLLTDLLALFIVALAFAKVVHVAYLRLRAPTRQDGRRCSTCAGCAGSTTAFPQPQESASGERFGQQ